MNQGFHKHWNTINCIDFALEFFHVLFSLIYHIWSQSFLKSRKRFHIGWSIWILKSCSIPSHPQEIIVKRLDTQDMLCNTIPSRKIKMNATSSTVQIPVHAVVFTSSIPSSPMSSPNTRLCPSETFTTPTLLGPNRHAGCPGSSAPSASIGTGSR